MKLLCTCSYCRDSELSVIDICKGFFMDPRHLMKQFAYITEHPPLNENVKQNLKTQIGLGIFLRVDFECYIFKSGNLELYLSSVLKTVQYKQQMDDIELTCHTEFNGLMVLKDIHIIVRRIDIFLFVFLILKRHACGHFDKGGEGKLLRIEADGEGEVDASPHIFAVLVNK